MIQIDYITYETNELKSTTIRLNAHDLEILRAVAKKDNRSFNYIINKIISEYIIFNPIISEIE